MKRDGEDRTCKLCGKKEGVIKAVKYCSNRRRLWACEECWTKYYKKEVESEKIKITDRIEILFDREKDLAASGRKLRNVVFILITLLFVEVLGQVIFRFVLGNEMFYGTPFYLSNELVNNWSNILGLIGGVLICVCLLFVIFRVIVYRICKMDE